MRPPTVYLLPRNLTDEQIEVLRDYLAITPLEAVLVTNLADIEYAAKITSHHATALTRPIGIVGDFEEIGELGDTTRWKILPLPNVDPTGSRQ